MSPALLDSDVLSEILKAKHTNLLRRSELYLIEHQYWSISAISLYEMERGLLDKRATRMLAHFDVLIRSSNILPVSVPVLHRTAKLWVTAKKQAKSRNDADLIIAATALEHELVLVTGNLRHFDWIEGLQLDSWD